MADYHTYFVGSQAWGWAAWVHNAGPEYGLSPEAATRLFPNSTLVEYGEGLSAHAHKLRLAGEVPEGVNLAVVQLLDGRVKVLPSLPRSFHSEEVLLKWLKDNNIQRSAVARLYSEFHPCVGCDPLVRAAFPSAPIEYSWPYRSTSLYDEISNAGRAMKRRALENLQ